MSKGRSMRGANEIAFLLQSRSHIENISNISQHLMVHIIDLLCILQKLVLTVGYVYI